MARKKGSPRAAFRGGYREAVAWIAINGSHKETDPEEIARTESVRMLASVMRKPVRVVAEDIAALRMIQQVAPQQKRVLIFIEEYIIANGRAPTLVEIKQEIGISMSRAHEIIGRLVDAGVLSKIPNVARGLALIER